jgi:hypothetical protein
MLIAALVNKKTADLVRPVTGQHSVSSYSDYDEFIRSVTEFTFDVALLQGHYFQKSEAGTLFPAGIEFVRTLSIPIILLIDDSADGFRLGLEIGRTRQVELAILHGHGEIEGLDDAIERTSVLRLAALFMASLEERLLVSLRGSRAQVVIERVFSDTAYPNKSAHADFAVATLNAYLRAVGLPTVRILRRVARVAIAVKLRRQGVLLKQIPTHVGCGSIDTLAREVRRLTGQSLGRLAASTDEATVLGLAAEACTLVEKRPKAQNRLNEQRQRAMLGGNNVAQNCR